MKLLVSVRSVDEALLAAEAGADFIDLKEPSAGALGALPLETIREVVSALRLQHPSRPISATVGDFAHDVANGGALPALTAALLQRVALTAACGVDYVKVGVRPGAGASALLHALAACRAQVVPVLIADDGLDPALCTQTLALPFSAVMLDTSDKQAGSLLARVAQRELQVFILAARASGQLVGLAGALRHDDLPALQRLAPDFAGFRSAVCAGDRTQALDAGRVQALRAQLRGLSARELTFSESGNTA